jgi:hypothetical protein
MCTQQRQAMSGGHRQAVIGSDGMYLNVKGEKVGLEVVVDDWTGALLGLDLIVSEEAEEVLNLIREVAEQVKAKAMITDD